MTETDVVLTEIINHTSLISLNRPERHHALNRELSAELANAFDAAEADDNIRVIVLTGTGNKAFCAGADMLEVSGIENTEVENSNINAVSAIDRVGRCPLPVIAAINGYCYGGGARLAIGCDIRLASEGATFRLPGAEYGLVVGASTLPRLVGSSKAKELIFTARKFTAHDACEWGFLSSVHPLDDLLPQALLLADEIAANSPSAVRASKAVIDAATLSDDAEALEVSSNKNLRGSPEQVERFRNATRTVTGR
jgi:enoyl-CoA hydratase/carnithine racemase